MIIEIFQRTAYKGAINTFNPVFMKRKGLGFVTLNTELRFSIYEDWGSEINVFTTTPVEERDIVKLSNNEFVYWGMAFQVVQNGDNLYTFTFLYSTDMYLENTFRDTGYTIDDIVPWLNSNYNGAYTFSDGTNMIQANPSIGFKYTSTTPSPQQAIVISPDRTLPIARVCKQMLVAGFEFNTILESNPSATGINPNLYLVSYVSLRTDAPFNINLDGCIGYEFTVPETSFTIVKMYLRKNKDAVPEYHKTYYALTDGTISDTPIIDKLIPPYSSEVMIFDYEADEGGSGGKTWTEFVSESETTARAELSKQSFNNQLTITFKRDKYVYYRALFNDYYSNEFQVVGKKGVVNLPNLQVNVIVGGISITDNIIKITFDLPKKRLI